MTTKKDNPCKDCPDRHIGCHSGCERYLAWKKYMMNGTAKCLTRGRRAERLTSI